jgi:hypothetical protein
MAIRAISKCRRCRATWGFAIMICLKMQNADWEAPRLNIVWHPFPQFVYLPLWQATPGPFADAPFTKREAYLRVVELPTRARRSFELAVNLAPDDDR